MTRIERLTVGLGLAFLVACGVANAQTQGSGLPYFPQVLPANTVLGNPTGAPGPVAAISASSLLSQISPISSLSFIGSGSATATFAAPSNLFTTYSLTWPSVAGTNGQFMYTNGTGALNWEGAGQIIGTISNDNAAQGNIGEIQTSSVASGSAVSLTTATTANVTNLSLSPGDWDCNGQVAFSVGGSTVSTQEIGDISSASATLNTTPAFGSQASINGSITGTPLAVLSLGASRFSLAASATVYLVARSNFTVSTSAAYGYLRCRRVR